MQERSLTAHKKLKDVEGYILYYETLAKDEETRLKLQQFKRQKNEIKTLGIRP